ncbi:MAG: rRNA maturation RNase YbeY [Mycoplasmatales bacterium]
MINIVDDYGFKVDEKKIKKYVEYLDENLNNKKDFSLVFFSDEKIKNMNNEFRYKDSATDVLSFEEFMDDYLGDIIISVDTLKRQAKEYKHSEERELFFLITHGYLHIHGYDHMSEDEENEMMKLQEDLLTNYGIVR